MRRNFTPRDIEVALDRVSAFNGNISRAAADLGIARRTLNAWYLHPPQKLSSQSTYKCGASGPNPAVCAFIEAQITELVRIGTEHGEETTKTWILNMARELQARDTLGEGWF